METINFDIDEKLQSLKSTIIEAFILFYGEDAREDITNKFNNTIVIGYNSYDSYKQMIDNAKRICTKEAVQNFFNKIEIEYSEEESKKYFGYFASLEYSNIKKILDNYTKDDEFSINIVTRAVCEIAGNDEIKKGDKQYEDTINKILNYKQAFEKSLEEYENTLETKYGKYIRYFEELKVLKEKLRLKHEQAFFEDIKNYISSKDRETLNSCQNPQNMPFYKFDANEILFGYGNNLTTKRLIDAWSLESEEILNDEHSSDYQKDSIKNDRIKFFKKMGINGDFSYEEYMSNPNCIRLIPNPNFVKTMLDIRMKHFKEFNEELIISLPHLQNAIKRKNAAKLLNKDDGFISVINLNSTCICTNTKLDESGNAVLSPLLFIFANAEDEVMDARIIHEFNHVFELNLLEINDSKIKYICGWDITEDNISDKEKVEYKSHAIRSFEMLNEIINEYIAQDITRLMHENGIYLFGKEGISLNTSHSGYQEKLHFFARDFYEKYRDILIKTRRIGNLEELYKIIGEDNFMEYNEFLYEMSEEYAGFKIYRVLTDLQEGKDTKELRKFKQNLKRKDEILSKMQNYTKNNNL